MNDELRIEATNLSNAIKGLETFCYERFSSMNGIALDDLNALEGLIAVISVAAVVHYKNVDALIGGLE